MPRAAAPTRTYERANLSFDMVNIPLDVYSGTTDVKISRKMLHVVPVMEDAPDPQDPTKTIKVQQVVRVTEEDGTVTEHPVFEDNPVGYLTVDKVTGEAIKADAVTKKVETEHGLVYVEDHEIEALFEINPRTIRVLEFQPQSLFTGGHYIPKNLYYVAPGKTEVKKKKVVLPQTAKAFTLLLTAMRKRSAMAVCEFTTRGVPKPCILLPDGTLWEVRHTEEVRERLDYPDVDITDAQVEQAGMLIDARWSDEVRDLTNERTALILAFAAEKARAGDFSKPVEVEAAEPEVAAEEDFMAMFSASIDAVKAAQAAKATG